MKSIMLLVAAFSAPSWAHADAHCGTIQKITLDKTIVATFTDGVNIQMRGGVNVITLLGNAFTAKAKVCLNNADDSISIEQ